MWATYPILRHIMRTSLFFFHSFLIHFLSPTLAVHCCFSTFHLVYMAAFFRKYGRKTTVLSFLLLLIRKKKKKPPVSQTQSPKN